MGLGRRVRAAILLAAAFVLCCVVLSAEPAHAGDDEDAHLMLFSGRDLWRNGAFLYGGFIVSPGGFEESDSAQAAVLERSLSLSRRRSGLARP